jgi:unsaturated rhamnogalacturonyl hydrolase
MTALAGAVAGIALSTSTSAAATPLTIVQAMAKADAYWLANGVGSAGATWQNATFHVGNLAYLGVSGATPNTATQTWAASNDDALESGAESDGPNDLAAGEVYLMLDQPDSIRARVASEVAAQNDTLWTYIDAVNMAMPSYARLGILDKSAADLNAMQAQFNYTENTLGLFNQAKGLWWRDASFKGTDTYWARGNGWVLMALAKVLQILPSTDPRYAGYLHVFDQMAAALVPLQLSDGFWGADLQNPSAYGYEESGTAFFTYAMAWGINAGILDPSVFGPVVTKAWAALSTIALQPSGEVGYVQGATTGASQPSDGQPVKVTDTAAYGVGGFLLAGSEMVHISDPPANGGLSAPTISGTAIEGQTLSEAHGGWSNSPTSYAYQWEDCDAVGGACAAIGGATFQTYTLAASDVGHTIRVLETARNTGGAGNPATSPATGLVAAASGPPSPPVASVPPPSLPPVTSVPPPSLPPVTSSPPPSRPAKSSPPPPPSQPARAAGPSPAQVKAALSTVLGPEGRAAKINAIVKAGGDKLSFTAPSVGRLVIEWYTRVRGRHTLIASANVACHRGGKAAVKITLTSRGIKFLKAGKSVKITTAATFTPVGGSSTSSTKTITLDH